MSDVDVVVLGGGPAGLAVAGALARRGRRVALFERRAASRARVGETIGPEVEPLLRELGAWDAMRDVLEEQTPHRVVRAAWGSDAIEERSSMTHPLGEGWHVDRARLDARLAAWARACGARVHEDAGRCAVARDGGGFVVRAERGAALRGAAFVDASGRGAPASMALGGRRWLACDRQVALVARVAARGAGEELLLESAEEGWWYSAPQPGALVVALVTDADLVAAGGRRELAARFHAALARTTHTAARTRACAAAEEVHVVRADSGMLLPDSGQAWRAVGDAAMATDPLAGNGVARALRAALHAADERPEEPRDAGARLAAYLDRRASFYLREARWPEALFWARRRPIAWQGAPIALDPEALLRWNVERDAPSLLAPAEALLPPRAIAGLRVTLATKTPAHVAMASLRAAAPLGDRRALACLELLAARGAIEVSAR